MKTTLVLILLLCVADLCYTQSPCQVQFYEQFLNANHINASFQPGGNKFSSGRGVDPGFFAPYPYKENPSSIFASAPWVGGFDDAGNLKLAAEEFSAKMNDFYPGPLDSTGLPFPIPCEQFNTIWSVYRDDIQRHIEDAYDGIIDDTIASVFGWPAYGNLFFEKFNGFPLPGNKEWAGFHDTNQNERYDPDLGEYPEVYFNNAYYIPDQTLWMVFHDADTHSISGGDPLHFEFQLSTFAFYCQENTGLNNTIFNSYKIINRAPNAIDSVFFGMWTDYDIGCSNDDYNGSDSTRYTEFAYNEDALDGYMEFGCVTGASSYGSYPPIQSRTYLSHPMNSLVVDLYRTDFTPQGRYNILNGLWPDGVPMVADSTAYIPGSQLSTTNFMFHGDPRDSTSWAELNFIHPPADRLPVSSVKIGRLEQGEFEVVEMAYMFHQDTTVDYLSQFTLMYNNLDSLFASADNLNETCLPFPPCIGRDCVWPGDFDHNGIADHHDLLTWGLMKDHAGASRARLISWKGHFADAWADSTLLDVNFKHGDGDGNGATNYDDLYPLQVNYKLTNPYYEPKALYPKGPEIVISSDSNFQTSGGRIRNLKIEVGTDIENVFGLAFEIDFDTALYRVHLFEEISCPEQSPIECFFDGPFQNIDNPSPNPRYAFVKTDHYGFDLIAGLDLYSNPPGLRLKEGVDYDDLPDTVRVRLKNLIAIDSAGNDLHIGANELIFLKNMTVASTDPEHLAFSVYPNPTSDFIHFDVEKEMTIHVYTTQGQLRDTFTASPITQVDISGYNPGIYFLKSMETGWVTKLSVH